MREKRKHILALYSQIKAYIVTHRVSIDELLILLVKNFHVLYRHKICRGRLVSPAPPENRQCE